MRAVSREGAYRLRGAIGCLIGNGANANGLKDKLWRGWLTSSFLLIYKLHTRRLQ